MKCLNNMNNSKKIIKNYIYIMIWFKNLFKKQKILILSNFGNKKNNKIKKVIIIFPLHQLISKNNYLKTAKNNLIKILMINVNILKLLEKHQLNSNFQKKTSVMIAEKR